MKYILCIGMIVLLASCENYGSSYKQNFENCMGSLRNFDYTARVEMCKVYAEKRMYEEFNETR